MNSYMTEAAIIARAAASGYDGLATEQETVYKDRPEVVARVGQRLRESLLASTINNFQTYISDLLREIIAKYPKVLEQSKVDVKTVFSAGSLNDLKKLILDEQVDRLSYQSFADLNEYMINRTSFALVTGELRLAKMKYFIEARNLITHNRGRFSRTSLRKLNSSEKRVGSKIALPPGLTVYSYINDVVMDIDERAIAKFKLPVLRKRRTAKQ
jgi:hypothetical protein